VSDKIIRTILDTISNACLKHHDTGEVSVYIEARRIVQHLKDNGFKIIANDAIETPEPALVKASVVGRSEQLKHYTNFLYEKGYLKKDNVLIEYIKSVL